MSPRDVLLILIPNLCPVNYYKQVISWLLGRQWVPKQMLYGCKYCVGDWGKDMWTAIFLADVSFFKTWGHIHIFRCIWSSLKLGQNAKTKKYGCKSIKLLRFYFSCLSFTLELKFIEQCLNERYHFFVFCYELVKK